MDHRRVDRGGRCSSHRVVLTGAFWWAGEDAVGFAILAGALLVPIAVGIAITQYRLFDIDRVVSRTVAYALIVAVLGLVFAAGVVWLPSLFGISDESPLLVATTTLVVFASFNPLRERIQELVDRKLNRSRYEARLVEERFVAEVQSAHDREELVGTLLTTVTDEPPDRRHLDQVRRPSRLSQVRVSSRSNTGAEVSRMRSSEKHAAISSSGN